ncbi:MAG: IPT/TIG domain-containing protein [Candidatus Aquicultorales bacterium]
MKKLRLFILVVFCLAFLLLPVEGLAVLKPATMEQLSGRSSMTVLGKVTAVESIWNEGHTTINSFVTLSVEERIDGEAGPPTVTIKVPGGKVGEERVVVSDMPVFEKGERTLVFLREEANGMYAVAGARLGKKTVVGDYVLEEKQSLDKVLARVKPASPESAAVTVRRDPSTSTGVFKGRSLFPSLSLALNDAGDFSTAATGWQTILNEDFEAAPSSLWGSDYWGIWDYRSYSGSYSAWCAGAVISPYDYYYPNNMVSWMVYGPFDLSTAQTAKFGFYLWNDSEAGSDYIFWGASGDGQNFSGNQFSGSTGGWTYKTVDLSAYCGDSSVWIGFRFASDSVSTPQDGAFVDLVKIEKYLSEDAHISSISPGSGSGGTGTEVTINGSGFGAAQGTGGVVFDSPVPVQAAVVSWSDTKIKVTVPPNASSGQVYVVKGTDLGPVVSNPVPFNVTFTYAGFKWPGSAIPVGYRINSLGTPDTANEIDALNAGFDAWNAVTTSSMRFSYAGTTSADATMNDDGINTISFDSSNAYPDAIAVSIIRGSGTTIEEEDVLFNDTLVFSGSGEPSKFDIQATMTHEAGHWYCLGDLYGDGDIGKTMYGFAGPGDTAARSLEQADIDGASWVYDAKPPTVPSNVTAGKAGYAAVVSWDASSDNVGVAAYRIERSTSQGGPFSEVGVTANKTFNDYGLSPGSTYYYRVRARDAALNHSAYSTVVSVLIEQGAVNDASGDGGSDAIALYNYGASTTGAWAFKTTGSASNALGLTFAPAMWWQSAAGGFDVSKANAVTGDFDGDGRYDIMALYNYGGTTSRLFFLKSTGNSFAAPTSVFYSTGWDWKKTKLVSGDFDGNGKEELFAFYTYGGTSTGVFVFEQNAQGAFDYRKVFHSDGWNWNTTRLLSAKEGGKTRVVAAYNYGGTKTGLWIFELAADGKLKYPSLVFVSEHWDFTKSRFLTGDVDGANGVDVIAFYNYGGTTTGAFAFKAGGGTFSYPVKYFQSTAWDFNRSTFIPGDFTGDGKADAGAVYDYGGGKTGIWVFKSTGTALGYPVMVYQTPYWNNIATKWIMPY